MHKQIDTQFNLNVCFFNTVMDTCVNSDWAKTITVTFVLKIINSKLVSNTSSHEEDLSPKCGNE